MRHDNNTKNASTIAVHSPFDDALLAELPLATETEIAAALGDADQLSNNLAEHIPLPERIAILRRLLALMREQEEDLAILAAQEGGKPLVDSKVEVARAIDGIELCIQAVREDAGKVVPMNVNPASSGRMAMTQYGPIGLVVAISAFNHPLNLIVHQVAPAVITGCPVIVKPAPETPLSCLKFIELLHEAGLPKAWAQALVIESSIHAEALATDPRVALLTFIGSARVGWMLRRKLSPGTRCILEHGGVAPVIVHDDADVDAAATSLAKGAFYHAGQVCVSVQRIFAHQNIANALTEKLAEIAEDLVLGDPLGGATDVGPLIRRGEVERVDQWVKAAVRFGAKVCCGGEPFGPRFYRPTVLTHVPNNCTISREEIFGPVVAIYSFKDESEAFQQANSLNYAFQAAVFSEDLGKITRAFNALDASAIIVNDHTAFRTDWMPFAGLKQSGLGVGGIADSVRAMQVEKMLVLLT